MKKQFVIWLALIAMILFFGQNHSVVAIDQTEQSIESEITYLFDKPLCLPGLYGDDPVDCLPYGASKSISTLDKEGFSYPIRELSAAKPDRKLTLMPVLIAVHKVPPLVVFKTPPPPYIPA